jgi:hypothetical protein
MSNPRYSQGSGGDCFFGLRRTLLLSLALHVGMLAFFSRQPHPIPAEAGVKLQAVIGKPAHQKPTVQHAAQRIDLASEAATPQKALREPDISSRGPLAQGETYPAIAPVAEGGYQHVPAGMDLSAYRLAVGRAFANLLDDELRAALPPGELIFRVDYRARGGTPSLKLTAASADAYTERLLSLMTQAVSLTPLPDAWLAKDYTVELRAEVGGRRVL